MARPKKFGLDYFPFDTDFFDDDKIQFVGARFGMKGENIAIRLLCKIFKEGYYYRFGEDESLLFAKRVGDGCLHSFVNDVVFELVKRGFFDRSIFDRFGILTSAGIQRRFLQATQERKTIEIIQDYWLLEIPKSGRFLIIQPNNDINPPNNEINLPISTQSKVKESKEKESKANTPPLPPMGEPDKIDFKKLGELFNSKFNGLLPQVTLPLSEARKAPIRARVREYGKEKILEMFDTALQSPHLLGHNDRGWKASFDWLFKPTNFPKVIEGNYLDKHGKTTQPFTGRNDAADRRASVANAKNLAIAVLQFDQTKESG
jgi:hypothetical protein